VATEEIAQNALMTHHNQPQLSQTIKTSDPLCSLLQIVELEDTLIHGPRIEQHWTIFTKPLQTTHQQMDQPTTARENKDLLENFHAKLPHNPP